MEPRSDLSLALKPWAQRPIPDHYKFELRNVGGNAVGRFEEKAKSFSFIQIADVDAAAGPLRDIQFSQSAGVDCVLHHRHSVNRETSRHDAVGRPVSVSKPPV